MDFNFADNAQRLIRSLDVKARRAMPVATRRAYAPALPLGEVFSSATPPATGVGATLGLTGKIFERAMLPEAIYEQGRKVFSPNDNIVTSLQALGAGVGNLLQNKPYMSGARTLYNNPGQRVQVSNLPADYRGDELRLAAAARAAGGPSAGGGIGGGNAASFIPYISNSGGFNTAGAERNYETEKLRAAQLAEQDQLSKKYRVADLTKAYNTAKGDEKERLGMEIFALTNPSLAKKVKPGQVGYETIQATRQANTPFASALSAISSPGSTNYQSAFKAPSSDIVSRSFEGASDEGIQAILSSTPDVSKGAVSFSAAPNETKIGSMSIADAFTGPAFNPSQENLSNLQLALLKEAFNKRLK